MALAAVFSAGHEAHSVEVFILDRPAGQSLARCSCGWSSVNVADHLSRTAAREHIAAHPVPTTTTT